MHLQFTDLSVHIGTVLLIKILPDETFHLTNVTGPFFEKKERAGDFSLLFVGGIRLGESLIEQQDNKRACNTAQGATSRNKSLGSAPLEIQYHQPTVCCLLKTVG